MKTLLKILIACFISIKIVNGQTQVITMTTSLPVGSSITFSLLENKDIAIINVDFGDGNLISKWMDFSSGRAEVTGTLVGSQTVKVYSAFVDKIYEFICEYQQLTSIDISNAKDLKLLICGYNNLTDLNVTNNPKLTTLWCNNNELSSLNITQNIVLESFTCSYNKLTSLDVINNTTLLWFYCSYNQLTFNTLPIKKQSWLSYIYAPQQSIQIAKDFNVSDELDLNDQLLVNGFTTNYVLKTTTGSILFQTTDYSLTDGKITFLKAQSDSVYCIMENDAFPDFTGDNVFKTTNSKISSTTDVLNSHERKVKIYSIDRVIYIETPEKQGITIYDFHGRKLFSQYLQSKIATLQIDNPGIYFVQISGNNGTSIKKVIVK